MVRPTRVAAMTALLFLTFATGAVADQWNDRTSMTFSAPVMVPGATLAPGTYVFKLADLKANRHTVQIFNEDETRLVATTLAVPMKRMDVTGDVVIKMNPTEAGAPVALKGWFHPGSVYGHEFVYPDDQARDIAARTKTLVLSSDIEGSDDDGGKLYTYDAEGRQGSWREDALTITEWGTWTRQRQAGSAQGPQQTTPQSTQEQSADDGSGRRGSGSSSSSGSAAPSSQGATTARVAVPGAPDDREATAPLVRNTSEGMTVELAKLEEDPQQYAGKTITVTGEVDDVLGPRLFGIDEPSWADLDREVLVYVPSSLAALVKEDDRVTVTGTLKTFDRSAIRADRAGLDWHAESPDDLASRPLLVASRIVGGDSNVALSIDVNTGRKAGQVASGGTDVGAGTTGTTGMAGASDVKSAGGEAPLTDAGELSSAGEDHVGRSIRLENTKVDRAGEKHGFWIGAGNAVVFVVPAEAQDAKPEAGQTMSLEGVILAMPSTLRDAAGGADNANKRIYVYATRVQ